MSKDVCFHCKRSLNKKFRVKYGENIYCGVCYGKLKNEKLMQSEQLKKEENIKKEKEIKEAIKNSKQREEEKTPENKTQDNEKCYTCGDDIGKIFRFTDADGKHHCSKCYNKKINSIYNTNTLKKDISKKCTGKCGCHNKKEAPKSVEKVAKEHSELQMSKITDKHTKTCAVETNFCKESGELHFCIHLEKEGNGEKGRRGARQSDEGAPAAAREESGARANRSRQGRPNQTRRQWRHVYHGGWQ